MQAQAWQDGNRVIVILVGETPEAVGVFVGTCRHMDHGLFVVPDDGSPALPISERAAINGFLPETMPTIVHARRRYLPRLSTLLQDIHWCVPIFWRDPWPAAVIPMPGLVGGVAISGTGDVRLAEMDEVPEEENFDPFDDAHDRLGRSVCVVTRLLALPPEEQRKRLGPTCLACDICRMLRRILQSIGPYLQMELPPEQWAAIEAVFAAVNAVPHETPCRHEAMVLDTPELQAVRISAQRMVQTFGWPATPPPPIDYVEGGGWAWCFDGKPRHTGL